MAIFDRKDDYLYIRWAHEVKRRDHWTCVVCGLRGVELHSHHLNCWSHHPEERYDLENGATMCAHCHHSFHTTYGLGNNTVEQFKEFESIYGSLIKVARHKTLINKATSAMLNEAERDEVVASILADLETETPVLEEQEVEKGIQA